MARLAAVAFAVAASAASVPASAAAGPPLGGLTQLPAPDACLAQAAGNGCTGATGLETAEGVSASADGRDVYVAAFGDGSPARGGIAAFRRGARGALTELGCVDESGAGGCGAGDGLAGARKAVVSRDGRTIYAISWQGGGGSPPKGAAAAFSRAGDGSIGSELGCVAQAAGNGCTTASPSLDTPTDLLVSADGSTLYVVTDSGGAGNGSVDAYALNPDGSIGARRNCVSVGPDDGCAPGAGLIQPLAVAQRGNVLYVAYGSDNALAAFNLNPDGSIGARTSCVRMGGGSGCSDGAGLDFVDAVAVNPAGKALYGGSRTGFGSGPGALTAFALGPDGTIGGQLSCVGGPPVPAGCAGSANLGIVSALAVGPDGATVHAASRNGVHTFALDQNGAVGSLVNCVTEPPRDVCAAGSGLSGAAGIAVAPDGASGYVASSDAGGSSVPGAVAEFARNLPPSCSGASVTVFAGQTTRISLPCSDPNGDPITTQVVTGPSKGGLTVVDQGRGSVGYTATRSSSGTDRFTFAAGDGGLLSPAAAVSIVIRAVRASGLRISPRAFAPARRGGSVARRSRRVAGARVRFRLSGPSQVRFTVERRRHRRYVKLRGGFSKAGRAGVNRLVFTGRLRRRALRPGRYRLTATPLAGARAAGRARAGFRIRRP